MSVNERVRGESQVLLKEALKVGTDILKSACIEAPALTAGALLCHVIKCDRVFLYSHGEYDMDREKTEDFLRLVNSRAAGKPLQYLTGHQEFMSLDFTVTPEVLIPRQDTEILVEAVVRHIQALSPRPGHEIRILDIGTGSGCIAVSLAYYVKNCRVTALDVSEKALSIAGGNAVLNGVGDRIELVHGDLFELWAEDKGRAHPLFDVIVSNPPYIPEHEIETLPREVKGYEPVMALNGGKDGLAFYRFIIGNAEKHLKPGGYMGFEVGYGQADAVYRMMQGHFCSLTKFSDLAGIDRVVAGVLKKTPGS
jgi:release factor glutamine methyltransferase